MALKIYSSVSKRQKIKFKRFWGLIPMFVEIKGEKVVKVKITLYFLHVYGFR